jgi:predicted ArsR family transcriptional regulator
MTSMESETTAHRLGPTRARVLALLQDAGQPLGAREIGERLGMHPNSVRFHLDALTARGLALRDSEPRTTPGRPKVTYAATATSPDVTSRRYRLLATVLAEFVQDQLREPAAAAEQTGRAWSRSMALPERSGPASEREAMDTLVSTLGDVGFDCRAVADPELPRVEISQCPFLEVAADHQEVVCSIHLGLMRGVLEQVRAPIAVRELEPLVEPSLCVAHLGH